VGIECPGGTLNRIFRRVLGLGNLQKRKEPRRLLEEATSADFWTGRTSPLRNLTGNRARQPRHLSKTHDLSTSPGDRPEKWRTAKTEKRTEKRNYWPNSYTPKPNDFLKKESMLSASSRDDSSCHTIEKR